MDIPAGICIFFFPSDFLYFVQICLSFNFVFADPICHGFYSLLFFDELDFVIFLGLIANVNQNHVLWTFLD